MLHFLVPLLALMAAEPEVKRPYFGIRVIDEETKRGVPLIELRTVNELSFQTDSAGWVAFDEPELMGREVYFAVAGPGYEHARDGFGFRGARLTPKAGTTAVVKVKRTNIAERIYRLTGEGIHRDSTLLGREAALPDRNALVLGQDSVQVTRYQEGLFWLWGDTNLANYPLGNFQTTAATSPAPGQPGCRGDTGIAFRYFTDAEHATRVRKMMPVKEPGAVWLFGLLTATKDGKETLLAHYSRHKSLAEVVEHGLVRFDVEAGVFVKVKTLEAANTWRYPRGNAVRGKDDYFYFASPFLHTRVKATWESLVDPDQYEAFAFDADKGEYSWRRDAAPTTQAEEQKRRDAGKLAVEKARYALADAVGGAPVAIHGGSIAWNEHRKKWILVGVQMGGKGAPSLLGEVWYAEADDPTGPWRKAIKVASHPRYSFYNPRHHAFLDEAGGRVIYFEGTYTHTFSGNPRPTPRYDYNQLMYRLDLDDARVKALR